MAIKLKFMRFIDKEINLEADVTSEYYYDSVPKFVRFCINSNEEFKDTKIYLIKCALDNRLSDEKIKNFLVELKYELKEDNNVVFILQTNRRDIIDLTSIGFLHCIFDNLDISIPPSAEKSNMEYYICDHAQIGAISLIADMQDKLDRVGYTCCFI